MLRQRCTLHFIVFVCGYSSRCQTSHDGRCLVTHPFFLRNRTPFLVYEEGKKILLTAGIYISSLRNTSVLLYKERW